MVVYIYMIHTHRCRLTYIHYLEKNLTEKEKEKRKEKWAKLIKQTGIGKNKNKKQIK